MNKSVLRQRVKDVLNGAGMVWTDDGYFECMRGTYECLEDGIFALLRAFDLDSSKAPIAKPSYVSAFDDIERVCQAVELSIDQAKADEGS